MWKDTVRHEDLAILQDAARYKKSDFSSGTTYQDVDISNVGSDYQEICISNDALSRDRLLKKSRGKVNRNQQQQQQQIKLFSSIFYTLQQHQNGGYRVRVSYCCLSITFRQNCGSESSFCQTVQSKHVSIWPFFSSIASLNASVNQKTRQMETNRI